MFGVTAQWNQADHPNVVREFASFAGMGGWLRLKTRAYGDAAARSHQGCVPYIRAVCSAQACVWCVCGARRVSTLSAGRQGLQRCTHACRAQRPPAPLL
eukprot:7381473-Prymnesium_polylepis.1